MPQTHPALNAAAPHSRIRAHRQRAGLTVPELAVQAGIGVSTLVRLEAGAPHVPRRSTKRVLATALGVDVAELFPAETTNGRGATRAPAA